MALYLKKLVFLYVW